MTSIAEGCVLDGLDLNDGTNYTLEVFSDPVPPKIVEWVKSADGDGAVLGRDPLTDVRVVTASVRIEPQATMDLALAKVAAITAKLEESERNPGGIALVRTPATSTKSGTLYVLSGQITDLPIMVDGDGAGWFVSAPIVTLQMTCKPFYYGTEVSAGTGTSGGSSPLLTTLELTGVAGDVPAEGRLVVTDTASQARRDVEWGLESRYYPTSSPPSLIVDSAAFVLTGFSGTVSGGTVTSALSPKPTTVCSTGVLSHVGTFRAKARVYVGSSGSSDLAYVRLVWQDGDGPLRANAWATTYYDNGFVEVDLGVIRVSPAASGTQKWLGQFQAYGTEGDSFFIDYLLLIPAGEGYGRARGVYSYQPGGTVAFDNFTGTTAGAALNAHAAPAGGSWATSGATGDFLFFDNVQGSPEVTGRSANAESGMGRLAVLGSTSYTDLEVGSSFFTPVSALSPLGLQYGVFARYVDASNFAYASLFNIANAATGPQQFVFTLATRVAGSNAALVATIVTLDPAPFHTIRLVTFATGRAVAQLLIGGGAVLSTLDATSSLIATGGTLATGKFGMFDAGGIGAVARYQDFFYAAVPAPDPIVIYSGRSMEVRSDSAIRPDSTNTYYGNVPGYRGGRFFVPPAGTRARKARVAVKARRNDLVTGLDDQVGDSLSFQVFVTPRYLTIS